jgi:predicted acyltransferase
MTATTHPSSSAATAAAASPLAGARKRVTSIDALRGFDMFWIMGPDSGHWIVTSFLVLLLGRVPPWLTKQLGHPEWEGFTAWDMIMPLFLFIVGVAMPFSLSVRLEQGGGRRAVYLRALRRVAVLWVLGMIAQGNLLQFRLSSLKLYSNTLQAIAAGYLIATVALVELRSVRAQAIFTGSLLVLYWLLMSFVPYPGHRAGAYTPDDNLAIWIDRTVLGHFQDGTHYTWILSSLGFGATVMMGVLAGQLLRSPAPGPRKVIVLIVAGLGCLAAGWAWSFVMPVIKHIWTSSMALVAGGWSLLLLALFYGLIDVLAFRRWAFPFIVIGANAIVAYMAQALFDVRHIGQRWFGGLCAHFGSAGDFILACATFGLLWVALWYLYRHRTFVRV